MRRAHALGAVLLVALLLAGCGRKGELRLPEPGEPGYEAEQGEET